MSKEPVFDEKTVKEALRAAGVVIPDNPDLRARVAEELRKSGMSPSLTLIANGNYAFVVPDVIDPGEMEEQKKLPDTEKMVEALKAAGVVIPADLTLPGKVVNELSRRGVELSPEIGGLMFTHFLLVWRD